MQNVILVYDGECPFCSKYAHYIQLVDTAGLILINARDSNDPSVQDVKQRGYDLDRGMVAIVNGAYYHGADALHVMAFLGSKSDLFNKINVCVFSSKILAVVIYPVLRAGRNIALWAKGAEHIHDEP